MTDQPAPSADTALGCDQCGFTEFNLLADGRIVCCQGNCRAVRALLAPELVRAPARPALSLASSGPANPLIPPSWYFTFGLGHPLRGRYVVIPGSNEDARRLMTDIFGQGNWAAVYDNTEGPEVASRRNLKELNLSPR